MTERVPPKEKLPLIQTLAYGAGQMAHQVFDSGPGYLLFFVYNISLGVNPVLLGVAQSIARAVDLFTDPIAGYLSDSLRHRFSPRVFIALGSLLGGLFFALIWLFPPGLSPMVYFTWLLVCFSVATIGWSFCSVPRYALGFEMTTDAYQRNKLMAVASFMAMLCNLGMCWAYAVTQLPIFGGTVNGARWVGSAMGAAIIIFGLLAAIFCKERNTGEEPVLARADEMRMAGLKDFFVAIKRVRKCTPFVLLAVSVFAVVFGIVATAYSVDPCIVIYHICGGSQTRAAVIMGAGSTAWLVTGLVLTPPILWLSRRIGKKETMIVFMSLALIGAGLQWFCYTPAVPLLFMLPRALFGAGIAALTALAPSMTADACDLEESISGARDSGMFSAFYNWTLKLGVSLGVAVTGVLLNMTGFNAAKGAGQGPHTILLMRLVDIGVSAVAIIITLVFLFRYSITDEQMKRVRAALERRSIPPDVSAAADGAAQT